MSSVIPMVSLSLNIDYIEKHVTLDRSQKGVVLFFCRTSSVKYLLCRLKRSKKALALINLISVKVKKYRSEVKKFGIQKKR